jgi:hypothetical protein
MYLFYQGPILFALAIILTILTAILFIEKKIFIKRRPVIYITLHFLFGAIFLVYFFNNSLIMAQTKRVFLGGHINEREIETDTDEGSGIDVHYQLVSEHKISINENGLFEYITCIIMVGGLCFQYYVASKENSFNFGKTKSSNPDAIVRRLIMGTLLLLCLLHLPYLYYRIVRIVICIGAITLASMMHRQNHFIFWLFWVFIAILFNPFSDIEYSKLVWNVIDVVLAVVLFTGATKKYIDEKVMSI